MPRNANWQRRLRRGVLDLGLPRRDGLEVLPPCGRRASTCRVLVLHRPRRGAGPRRGLDLGADDYVVKPVDLHELARACARWCAARTASRRRC
jgi:two-component system OmpR family response regulator/two-component system response regulator QseB